MPADAWWTWRFPAVAGPVALLNWRNPAQPPRTLLGGFDDCVRYLDESALSDSVSAAGDTALGAEVDIGPVIPAGLFSEAKLIQVELHLGESGGALTDDKWSAAYEIRSGRDPAAALLSPERVVSGAVRSPGRQAPIGVRLAGSAFILHVASDAAGKGWVLDSAMGRFAPAGRLR